MRRQTLRALAESRGCELFATTKWGFKDGDWWSAEAGSGGPCVVAPTKTSAEAGLRAALEAMPERKAAAL